MCGRDVSTFLATMHDQTKESNLKQPSRWFKKFHTDKSEIFSTNTFRKGKTIQLFALKRHNNSKNYIPEFYSV